jgi:hypothetical protein
MRWRLSFRADPEAAALADRHYTRQKPGAAQFVPPGRCLVLVSGHPVSALWVTSWPLAAYVKHAWGGAWMCSLFRNEGEYLSSDLIREAVAATRWHAGAVWRLPEPALGFVSFVDAGQVGRAPGHNPGACYRRAGWKRVGATQGGLLAFQQLPAAMPSPEMPLGASRPLLEAA